MKLKEGQVWLYKNRNEDNNSMVRILKIEDINTIHISVSNVCLGQPPECEIIDIEHLPFSAEALKLSLTQLNNSNSSNITLPEGYFIWQKAYERQEAGIYNITIAEAISHIISTIENT